MRIFLVVVILTLLFFAIRQQVDLQASIRDIDPILLGYGALFAAGIVMAEILRPILTYVSAPVRFVVVALVAGLGWWGYTMLTPNMVAAPVPAAAIIPAYAQNLEIPLSWDDHFRTVAQINGQEAGVLIDTGASLVLLTYAEAARMGMTVNGLDFTTPLSTAGVRIHVSPVTFVSVRLGDIRLTNVKGAIARKGDLQNNLIGLSFLRNLGEAAVIGDSLHLRK